MSTYLSGNPTPGWLAKMDECSRHAGERKLGSSRSTASRIAPASGSARRDGFELRESRPAYRRRQGSVGTVLTARNQLAEWDAVHLREACNHLPNFGV